jgi:hypothetical protein
MYPDLNLPSAPLKLIKDQEQIFVYDIIRKKNILLTPEEWVRQHFIHFLIEHRAFPKTLFKVETSLSYNRLTKRSDIKVYNREGNVFMLVECKAFSVPLTEQTLKQASAYNKTLNADWLVITNGLTHYAFQKEEENGTVQYIKKQDIPTF